MEDILQFEAPFGWLGWIVERLILMPYMRRFLTHRNENLKRLAEHS
ncbi:SRPBCC family protein [Paenibacillus arenilitoris]|uniref:Uncharacterized protein n=1 Tax=Paenibacillus arenilitoris TaxID=2772299 RepID=A0A927CPH4_9BACL|nr:hypothetical protein [Paenibacillus arenilitoris]MBD2871125.1 hypothetical protein [Paenibacillus arenilitoris]